MLADTPSILRAQPPAARPDDPAFILPQQGLRRYVKHHPSVVAHTAVVTQNCEAHDPERTGHPDSIDGVVASYVCVWCFVFPCPVGDLLQAKILFATH